MKPDISEKEKKVYVTLYKKDAPSYAMILLATLLEFVYVVSILDVMPVTFMMGVAVIVNIFFLFFIYFSSLQSKRNILFHVKPFKKFRILKY